MDKEYFNKNNQQQQAWSEPYPASQPAPNVAAVSKSDLLLRNCLLFLICLLAFSLSLTIATVLGENNQEGQLGQNNILNPSLQASDDDAPEPSDDDLAEAQRLSQQMELTKKARTIFLANKPLFFSSRQDENFICDKVLKTTTYGCWYRERIYVLEHGAKTSTTAHELLHAIFYRDLLNLEEQDIPETIKADLETVYENNQDLLKPIIDSYQEPYSEHSAELQELLIYNELHSYVGTMIADVPERLEKHYALYFKDRQKIIDLPQLHESFI